MRRLFATWLGYEAGLGLIGWHDRRVNTARIAGYVAGVLAASTKEPAA